MLRVPDSFDVADAWAERLADRARRSPLDPVAHVLSSGADRSLLWVGLAGLRAVRDPARGRRAAVRAVTVIGAQSGVVHFGVKRLFARRRPQLDRRLRFGARRPPSTSFPSGHAASAAAAAVLLADGDPRGKAIVTLALLVAWSRVQTGLHHATDVAAGLALGAAVGALVRRAWRL